MAYIGTEYNRENALSALKKASEWHRQQKQKRIDAYNKKPNRCARQACSASLPYEGRHKQYCSRQCSCSTLSGRIARTDSQKAKALLTRKRQQLARHEYIARSNCLRHCADKSYSFTMVKACECIKCDNVFFVRNWQERRKLLCNQCFSKLDRIPYSGIKVPFVNPYDGELVTFDSSWELAVAKALIERNIRWTKPEPISWVDSLGKVRRYVADFYLPNYDVFLDPKNDWVINHQKEKLDTVSRQVTLVYGSVKKILQHVDNMVRVRNSAVLTSRSQTLHSTSELQPGNLCENGRSGQELHLPSLPAR